MKNTSDVMLTGEIVESRLHGEASHPICIHRVAFNNGKFALIRSVSNINFATGAFLKRNSQGWFLDNKPEKLLPFEYINEQESKRRFREN
ncbi:hypothetical protein [Atlantibacter hermannii]|uniref:hypothetical protein n=1 Tax=Atlantibacter hermannii TaxID=565 RepID=UPI00289DBD98|nr:hypothetical protein [Atlantibacter hermannii]MCQ4966771.1 hypothetical protein [Enterobacteriaceae bacterium DFI.7.85]